MKTCGGLSALACVPSTLRFIDWEAKQDEGELIIPSVRECILIDNQRTVARWDISAKGENLYADCYITNNSTKKEYKDFCQARIEAQEALLKEMRKRNIYANQLKRLPMPTSPMVMTPKHYFGDLIRS